MSTGPTTTELVMAQVLTSGIRLRNEKVTELVEQPNGEIQEMVTINKVDAQPGDIIDVTDWAHIQAYVERGQITLLTQDQIAAHKAAEAKAATGTRSKAS